MPVERHTAFILLENIHSKSGYNAEKTPKCLPGCKCNEFFDNLPTTECSDLHPTLISHEDLSICEMPQDDHRNTASLILSLI